MSLFELFDLREKIESRVNQYWTYWSISIFAVCGWIFAESSKGLDPISYILISLGMLVFFIANISVLKTSTELAMSITDEIALKVAADKFHSQKLNETLLKEDMKYRVNLTIVMHLVIDLVMLFALLTRAQLFS